MISKDLTDVNLLLAASELLAACESALEVWRKYPLDPNDPTSLRLAEVYLKIRRAVKKAKGGD